MESGQGGTTSNESAALPAHTGRKPLPALARAENPMGRKPDGNKPPASCRRDELRREISPAPSISRISRLPGAKRSAGAWSAGASNDTVGWKDAEGF